jgi:hypothetical protein
MTTGRINQVTLVKRRGKKDRSLARPLKSSHSFFVTRTAKKLPGSGSVIRYDSVEFTTHVCNNHSFAVRQGLFIERYLPQTSYCQVFSFFP